MLKSKETKRTSVCRSIDLPLISSIVRTMKNLKKLFLFTFVGALPLALTSCSIYDILFGGFPGGNPNASNGVNHEGDWTTDVLPFSLKSAHETYGADTLPPTGDAKLLVLPIEFTDSPFSSRSLKDLDVALNGKAEDTGYWESVSSFYSKSSYGKSNLSFEVAPVYKTGLTQRNAYSRYVSSRTGESDNGGNLIHYAYDNYVSAKGKGATKAFDSDGNGYIDGVVAVYSGPNCTNAPTNLYDSETNYYWAYTYWMSMTSAAGGWCDPNPKNPTPNLYFWLSYDFLYQAVSSPKVDAHTLIHETGHMYGLDDYYPNQTDSKANLAGGWDMMDENILDHDAYSKMVLGWTSPHVVQGPGTYSINPSATSGDCLLIPSSSWNGTAYDEYMLLELYTPTDLNYLDSHERYPGRLLGYSTYGAKLYHIDSRLLELKQNTSTHDTTYSYMENPKGGMKAYDGRYVYGYMVGASNCNKNDGVDSRCSLIHMMEADNDGAFAAGKYGTNNDLFHTGDSFSMKTYRSSFPFRNSNGDACFNKGSDFPYRITFDEVAADHATVTISLA